MLQGDVFAAYVAKLNEHEGPFTCKACKAKEAMVDYRVAPSVGTKETFKELPPLLAFEISDSFDGRNSPQIRRVVKGEEFKDLHVTLIDGTSKFAQYRLLAVCLYNGGHYVVEARAEVNPALSSAGWMRYNGMYPSATHPQRGQGVPMSAPPNYDMTGDDGYYPVTVIYQRIP